MRQGDIIEVEIDDWLAQEAQGVGHHNGLEVRVAGAAPGSRVQARIERVSTQRPMAWATATEVLDHGPQGRSPACPHAFPLGGRCGGCPLMILDEAVQREVKARRVLDALGQPGLTLEVTPAPQPLGYRNRGHFVVSRRPSGQILLGSYAPRSHDVADMAGCLVLRAPLAEVAAQVAALMTRLGVPAHPEPDGARFVTLRADPEGRTLVDVVVNARYPEWLDPLATQLMTLEAVVGVAASVNASTGNAMRVAPSRHLAGAAQLKEPVGPLAIPLEAAAFSQLNSEVAAQMYAQAADWADQPRVIWDLYCGSGGLGLTVALASPGCHLYGAESSPGAVTRAAALADELGVAATFEAIDLSAEDPEGWPAPDLILVNPPRRGLDRAVLNALSVHRATPVIYMSCGPESFAQDVARLTRGPRRMTDLRAWDMLPQTTHVELLARFAP